jgi:RNA 2',3'-cyclic 3'-phosphodiesterase
MRAFLGFAVPDALSLELLTVRDQAVARLASAGPQPVIAANFHMTLAFLGDIDPLRTAAISMALDALVSSLVPAQVRLDQAHCFPDARSTIFAAEAPADEHLIRLQRRVLRVLGEPETRPFRPHITLARLKRAYVPAPSWPLALPFEASELCLYESVSSEWGVRYRVVRRWLLGQRSV